MPSDRQLDEGEGEGSLTVLNVDRTAAGLYVCTADNGVGEPVSRTVTVNVRCKLRSVTLHTSSLDNVMSSFLPTVEAHMQCCNPSVCMTSVRPSVYIFHANSSTTVHFRAMVTVEH